MTNGLRFILFLSLLLKEDIIRMNFKVMMFQIIFLGIRPMTVLASELEISATFPLEMSSKCINILVNFVTIWTLDFVLVL